MAGIVDNQKELKDGLEHFDMLDVFKKYFNKSKNFRLHVGTGFFFIEGFGELYNSIDIEQLQNGTDEYKEIWGTKAPILVLMGKETNQTTKEALINAKNMIKYALNAYDEGYLNFLENLIEKGLIKFKVFTDSRFHAKIYFFYDNHSIMDVFVGSANLTYAGLKKNIELTAPISGDFDTREAHSKWFEKLWNRSTDDLNVLEIIKSYKKQDFVYYEPKKFFENIIKLQNKDYLFYRSKLSDNTFLVEFQSFDFYQVMRTLDKYNGCILASSVGLGKSYVALEVMRYIENNGNEALLVGPSNLVKGKGSVWNEYLKKYNLKVERIGYGDLQQPNFDASKYNNYDLVVIDEAHNLRNQSNTRKNIIKVIKNSPNAKYLLMTATPINIKISDLTSIIDLFYDVNRHNWIDLKVKYEYFKSKVNKLEKNFDDSEELFKEVVELQKYIERELIVKSTRNMIRKYFSEDLKKLAGTTELPDPIVKSENYNYPKEYHTKFFNILSDFLIKLNQEHSKFYLDEKEGPKYSEERNIIYRYKWLLYKRSESSIYSFYTSINRLKQTTLLYISFLENRILDEEIQKIPPEREERLKIAKISFDKLDEIQKKKILLNMNNDVYVISKMIKELENLKDGIVFKNDTKLKKLVNILNENVEKKCLIFTEYFDTLEYLFKNLKKEFNIDYVAGKTINNQSMKPSQKESKIKKFKDNTFQHLLSTDVLAEGFNLPEADIVINYDLPYNPVKMIQRVGRATRINVPNQIEIRNFNPDESIDQELNLVERLNFRISNIISMIGIDYSIWANTEQSIKEREHLDSVNKGRVLKELKKRIVTENPDEIYQIKLRDESKLDILLRKSIEHYDIKPEDIPLNNPLKPIYTTLMDKKPGFYGIYQFDKDFFEYGNPSEFILEPSQPIKTYDSNEVMEFCEIIKDKYIERNYRKDDAGIRNKQDKTTIMKLNIIKKNVVPLRDVINKILRSNLHTNYKIAEIVKKEIYPSVKDGFNWFKEKDKVKKWKYEFESILETENGEDLLIMENILKDSESYKTMIKAFIQYEEVDWDV